MCLCPIHLFASLSLLHIVRPQADQSTEQEFKAQIVTTLGSQKKDAPTPTGAAITLETSSHEGSTDTQEHGKRRHSSVLIANFGRNGLGQGNGGHFAPVAALAPPEETTSVSAAESADVTGDSSDPTLPSEQCLVLDVNSHKWPSAVWCPVSRLWGAVHSQTGYGFFRGYMVVSVEGEEEGEALHDPPGAVSVPAGS